MTDENPESGVKFDIEVDMKDVLIHLLPRAMDEGATAEEAVVLGKAIKRGEVHYFWMKRRPQVLEFKVPATYVEAWEDEGRWKRFFIPTGPNEPTIGAEEGVERA